MQILNTARYFLPHIYALSTNSPFWCGRNTGFMPYITHLRPDQVVLGYLAPNRSGFGDGQSIIPTNIIKRAIQCLRTGNIGCNTLYLCLSLCGF